MRVVHRAIRNSIIECLQTLATLRGRIFNGKVDACIGLAYFERLSERYGLRRIEIVIAVAIDSELESALWRRIN